MSFELTPYPWPPNVVGEAAVRAQNLRRLERRIDVLEADMRDLRQTFDRLERKLDMFIEARLPRRATGDDTVDSPLLRFAAEHGQAEPTYDGD